MTEESPKDKKKAAGQDAPAVSEMDEVIEMKDSVHVGPFQAEILKGRVARAPAHDMHCNGSTYQACRGGKWESMPTTPRTTSVACVHHTHGW